MIGEKIRKLRKQKNFSQEDLAGKLNVHSVTVSKWENGTMQPRTQNIKEMAEIFGVPSSYLIEEDNFPKEFSIRNIIGMNEKENEKKNKPSANMAYWGGVIDNARDIAKSGNSEDIFDVSQMLKRALASLEPAMTGTMA